MHASRELWRIVGPPLVNQRGCDFVGNLMQPATGSQWKERSNGVVWGNSGRLKTSQAARFWIKCKGLQWLTCQQPAIVVQSWNDKKLKKHLSGLFGLKWLDPLSLAKEKLSKRHVAIQAETSERADERMSSVSSAEQWYENPCKDMTSLREWVQREKRRAREHWTLWDTCGESAWSRCGPLPCHLIWASLLVRSKTHGDGQDSLVNDGVEGCWKVKTMKINDRFADLVAWSFSKITAWPVVEVYHFEAIPVWILEVVLYKITNCVQHAQNV